MVKTVKIIECETYSRVVGYYRPIQQFNPGKKAEFMARKLQKLPKEVISVKRPDMQ
jgi:hypothetical protein